MKYLIDTDHISILQRRSGTEYVAISARIARCVPDDLVFSVVSFHEQVVGAHAYINAARTMRAVLRGYSMMKEIEETFAASPMLPFDQSEASVFDNLRAARVQIKTMDLRIAATALSRGLILVTRNVRDFSQVPVLVTEDWTV